MDEEKKLRKRVQRLLEDKIPDDVWQWAVSERIISSVLMREPGFDEEYLAGQVWSELRRRGKAARHRIQSPAFVRKQRREKGSAVVTEALSELLAAVARNRPDVQEFRKRVLRGSLLKAVEVGPWIADLQEKEPALRTAVVVQLPREVNLRLRAGKPEFDSDVTIGSSDVLALHALEVIAYAKPGCQWVQTLAIGFEGPLKELRDLCENLKDAYKWENYQASMFVLTDVVPLISRFRYQVNFAMSMRALSRVSLIVDPVITPRELAQQYKKIRASCQKPEIGQGKRRPRALTQKHARLAVFAAGIPKAELDPSDMKTWNRKYPKWKYSLFKNFNRDWKVAQSRLLQGAPFDIPLV
jgi:hypothetical protein